MLKGGNMGVDFECGCRLSCGKWILCPKHEDELMDRLEILTEPQI